MQVASVIGRDFAFRILQTITGMREDLKSHLLNLQGLEFIYEKRLFPELEYIFKHILTQEVAYNSLLVNRRKEYHEKIGAAVEDIYPDRLEEFYEMLAYHYSKSENHEKAFHYLKLAGTKAVEKHSPREAFHFYKEALNTIKKLPMTRDRKKDYVSVTRLFHIPNVSLGWPDEYLQYLEEGSQFAEDIADYNNRSRLLADMGFYYCFKYGDVAKSTQCMEEAMLEAEKLSDTETFTSTVTDYGFLNYILGKIGFIDISHKAISRLEKEGKKLELFFGNTANVYVTLTTGLGFAYGMLGDIENGEIFCEKGLRTAYEMNHQKTIGVGEYFVGSFYLSCGGVSQAMSHFNSSLKHCYDTKYYIWLANSLLGLARSYLFLDDVDSALGTLKKWSELNQQLNIKFTLSLHDIYSSMIHFNLADYRKALDRINDAIKFAQDVQERHYEGYATLWKGRILWHADSSQTKEAEDLLLQGCNNLESLKLMAYYAEGYLYLGQLYANTGQGDKALEYLNKAESCFRQMGSEYWLAKTHELYDRL